MNVKELDSSIVDAYTTICRWIQEQQGSTDLEVEDMANTPLRCTKALAEAVVPIGTLVKELTHHLSCVSTVLGTNPDTMLVQGPIQTKSMCPHHLLPVFYEIWIGLCSLPSTDKDGKTYTDLLGLSKIARIVKILSKRAVLQEELAENIADIFSEGTEINQHYIKGYGADSFVLLHAVHSCMVCRGVEEHAITSSLAHRVEYNTEQKVNKFFTQVNSSRLSKPI